MIYSKKNVANIFQIKLNQGILTKVEAGMIETQDFPKVCYVSKIISLA